MQIAKVSCEVLELARYCSTEGKSSLWHCMLAEYQSAKSRRLNFRARSNAYLGEVLELALGDEPHHTDRRMCAACCRLHWRVQKARLPCYFLPKNDMMLLPDFALPVAGRACEAGFCCEAGLILEIGAGWMSSSEKDSHTGSSRVTNPVRKEGSIDCMDRVTH